MEHEIRTILNGYAEAVWNKDSDAFLALYDKDLIDFDTWSEWSYNGKEAFSRMPLTWFKDLADDRVRVTFVNPTITTDGNLAAVWTEVIYAAYDQKDRLLRFMTNRLTWILHLRKDIGRFSTSIRPSRWMTPPVRDCLKTTPPIPPQLKK